MDWNCRQMPSSPPPCYEGGSVIYHVTWSDLGQSALRKTTRHAIAARKKENEREISRAFSLLVITITIPIRITSIITVHCFPLYTTVASLLFSITATHTITRYNTVLPPQPQPLQPLSRIIVPLELLSV